MGVIKLNPNQSKSFDERLDEVEVHIETLETDNTNFKNQVNEDNDNFKDEINASINVQLNDIAHKPFLIAAIGDSRLADSLYKLGITNSWSNKGALGWAMFLTNQKFVLPSNYDLAVSGYTTTQILGLVPSVLALNPKPSYCIVNGATNDNPMNLNLLIDNYKSIANSLMSSGIKPIFITDFPRALSAWDSNSLKVHNAFNNWLRKWCRDNGYLLADPYISLVDQVTGDPLSATTIDGIHASCKGGYLRGKGIADILNTLPSPQQDSRMQSVLDVYDATYNKYGNLLGSIGLLQGTAGTNTGTGASGTVSSGWNNRVISGTCTCVASKENPRSDGLVGDKQILTINATTLSSLRYSPINSITGWSVGDKVIAEMDLDVAANSVGLDYVNLTFFAFDGASNLAISDGFKGDTVLAYPLPTVAYSGRMRTIPFVIPSGATNLYYRVEAQIEAGGSAVIKIGNATIRKIYSGDGTII